MSKLNNIINGWKNFTFKNPEIESMAKERAVHCSKCPEAVSGWFEKIQDGVIKEISGLVCNGCETKVKCPLSTKLRSKQEVCPKKNW